VSLDPWWQRHGLMVCGGLIAVGLVGVLVLLPLAIQHSRERSRATLEVEDKLAEARGFLEEQKFDEAFAALDEAACITQASNLPDVARLRQEAETAKKKAVTEAHLTQGERLFCAGRFGEAASAIDRYQAAGYGLRKSYASQLRLACDMLKSADATAKYLTEMPEKDFTAVRQRRLPEEFAELRPPVSQVVLDALGTQVKWATAARGKRKEFEAWVQYRLYKDRSTRDLFDSHFTGLMDLFDRESVTARHRMEYAEVQRLFSSIGFAAFLSIFEEELRRLYNAGNFKTADHESELRSRIRDRKNEIVKEVITAVAGAIPNR
jgi:hypothetical protein